MSCNLLYQVGLSVMTRSMYGAAAAIPALHAAHGCRVVGMLILLTSYCFPKEGGSTLRILIAGVSINSLTSLCSGQESLMAMPTSRLQLLMYFCKGYHALPALTRAGLLGQRFPSIWAVAIYAAPGHLWMFVIANFCRQFWSM